MESKDFKGRFRYFFKDNNREQTILLLSGFQDTGRGFYFLEDYLSEKFNLIAPDWRGHGDSPHLPEGWFYSSGMLLADFVQFTGEIVEGPYHILAHSMGSALAARHAGLVGQEVQSLVLIEGFSGRWPAEKEADRMTDWVRKLRKERPPRESRMPSLKAARELLARAHPRTPEENRAILAELWTNEKDGGFTWKHDPALRSRMLPIPFPPDLSRELWSRIQCPTLFVYGKHSPLKPPDDQIQEILSHFRRLKSVELESGHNPHQEMPETMISVLEEFYRESL
ncbi:MAG: alpha/beta hydrolase [Spirochaetaceae bacterium]|nr:alpha/beta hydrolase [Spirochaetaceae bacterium]|tara:strand:- start:93047 stop:93892 length:846 start_codon:yes stop_codon:yes gene_type:complete